MINKKFIENSLLWFAFFIIIAFIACYENHKIFLSSTSLMKLGNNYSQFLQAPANKAEKVFGTGDDGAYIRTAEAFKANYLKSSSVDFWPPGQPAILILLFKMTGENYFPLKMLLLTTLVWSFALMLIYHSIPTKKYSLFKFALVLLPFYFVTFLIWIFGSGIFLSETFSLPLFIISVCLFIYGLQTQKSQYFFGFAIVLAALAYLRGYFEFFGNFLVFILLFAICLKFIWLFITKKVLEPNVPLKILLQQTLQSKKTVFTRSFNILLLSAILFMLLLLPWRLYNHYTRDVSLAWLHADFNWPIMWTPDDKLDPFYKQAALNVPCHIEPFICKVLYQNDVKISVFRNPDFYKKLTIMMVKDYPLRWYGQKIKYLNGFWFGPFPLSWHELLTTKKWLFVEGILIFMAGAMTILYGLFSWRTLSPEQHGILIFSLLFILFNGILFTFYHYEPRYSLFLRILFLYLPLWFFSNGKYVTKTN